MARAHGKKSFLVRLLNFDDLDGCKAAAQIQLR